MLHRYFEGDAIERDAWLFAVLTESSPAAVAYFVRPPSSWDESMVQRLEYAFRELELARRFAVEAASELVGLGMCIDQLSVPDRRSHLDRVARAERGLRRNSWKAAMYEALANSAWYQKVGFAAQPADPFS